MNMKNAFAMVAVTATILSASAAMADILPSGPSGTTVTGPIGGVYTYTYDMALATPETLTNGNYFTIYDFNGLTGTVTDPAGWTYTEQATGATPPLVVPTDTSTPNVTFTWNGGTVTSPAELGLFSIQSTFAPVADGTQYAGYLNGGKDQFLHTLTGPGTTTAVPEPATVVPFAIGGLALLGLIARKARRNSSVSA